MLRGHRATIQWHAQPLYFTARPHPDIQLANILEQECGSWESYILADGDLSAVQEAAVEIDVAASTNGDVISLWLQTLLIIECLYWELLAYFVLQGMRRILLL